MSAYLFDKIPQGYLKATESLSDIYVKKIKNLYTLPEIYYNVKSALEDPNKTLHDIGKIIQFDIALSAKIIGMINSAYFSFPRKITNIQHAVSILGRDKIEQLVLTATVTDVFKHIPKKIIDMTVFWEKSATTALLAQEIAKTVNHERPDNVFTAALLHDIGRLVMLCQSPKHFLKVIEKSDGNQLNMIAVELEVFGFSHSQAGAALLKSWQLPELYQQTARYHHFPVMNKDYGREIAIVYLAENIAEYYVEHNEYNPELFETEYMINSLAFEKAGVHKNDFANIVDISYKHIPETVQTIYPKAA